MQNRGLIKLFAVLFGIVSLYHLSFTYFSNIVEDQASEYASKKSTSNNPDELAMYNRIFLDSVADKPIVNLGFAQFTYNDIRSKELNLGLDLKGGINVILKVSVKDILKGLSNDSKNIEFNRALDAADLAEKSSDKPYLDLFFLEFDKISKGTPLSHPSIFGNKLLREQVNGTKTNEEVQQVLASEVSASVSTAFQVLRSRIDKFGVTQPNIQRLGGNSGRILIELPGARDIERVRKLLQSTAELQFWEAYSNSEVINYLIEANVVVTKHIADNETVATKDIVEVEATIEETEESKVDALLGEDSDSEVEETVVKGLFTYLQPEVNNTSSVIGYAALRDTAKVNKYLGLNSVRSLRTKELKYAKFMWDAKTFKSDSGKELITLYAIRSNRADKAPISGDVIVDAGADSNPNTSKMEVTMAMNSLGTKQWAKMTTNNIGKFVAVVLDGYVYSAPSVSVAITSGMTSISGSFTVKEAQDLANILKAGKLPAAAHIEQSDVVGPSLGQKSIDSSMISFGLALLLVLAWMVFYYGKSGFYANVALAVNILFLFGIFSGFGFVLTLPGIAGIILTIGMSVDANVLIFERIKEELAKGAGFKEGVQKGYSHALSSILDANITTLLTGFILYSFGTGPIKGFALTLIIGIFTSLFCAIFISRLMIDRAVRNGVTLNFNTGITKGWFQNINIDFLKKRKTAYIISLAIILGGIFSLYKNSLNFGVDFVGGRSYIVQFDKNVDATSVAADLKDAFGSQPEVKTYGSDSQLKITTKFMIDDNANDVDDKVLQALFSGLSKTLPEGMSFDKFINGHEGKTVGMMSYMTVAPSIADDIKTAAGWSIIGSLIVVFLYILLRFRKWQYSLGAVIAVFHDVLIVLSVFSITYKIMPFDMEIGQSFIAAILTVVGYSLNDTVVIFDRIREFTGLNANWKYSEVVNKALSSTLGRTINTSLTTLIVLTAIMFFGGDSIKGFMFALIIGVFVGTYSSLFIASPIMYDTSSEKEKK
ncbi:MAG: protein translocase subunit SecDF [Flavobacteriaceae bacterium]|nr:protein translocase subunit SecDF [Flavobacteriaceae bacterium]